MPYVYMTTENKIVQVAPVATTVAPPPAAIWTLLLMRKNMPAPIMRKIQNTVAPARQSEERKTMVYEFMDVIRWMNNDRDFTIAMAVDRNRMHWRDFDMKYREFYNRRENEDRVWDEELEIAVRIVDQQREEAERLYQGGDMTNDVATTIAVA
jgi:hypothetical protein